MENKNKIMSNKNNNNKCDEIDIKTENVIMEAGTSDANIKPIQRVVANLDDSCTKISSNSLIACTNVDGCLSLLDILESFNAAISEEQAWALIYQSVKLYRDFCQKLCMTDTTDSNNDTSDNERKILIQVPATTNDLKIHKDGSVHISILDSSKLYSNMYCNTILYMYYVITNILIIV